MIDIDRIPGTWLIENQMIDTCLVNRNIRGVYDDILNEDTGELIEVGVVEQIYSGKCLVAAVNAGDKELGIAEMPKEFDIFKVILPNNTATNSIKIGDELTVTNSKYRQNLNNVKFRVSKFDKSTHSLYVRLMIEEQIDSIGTSNPAAR